MPESLFDDGSVDVEGTYARAQYDNGVAAGSPPDFAPVPVPGRTFDFSKYTLPRLGPQPILVTGPGITPNAPKTGEGAQEEPTATKVAPSPLSGPGMPVLRAAPGDGTARVVNWPLVITVSLVLLTMFYLLADRDDE